MSTLASDQVIFEGKLLTFIYNVSSKNKTLFEIIYVKDDSLYLNLAYKNENYILQLYNKKLNQINSTYFNNLFYDQEFKDITLTQGWGRFENHKLSPIYFDKNEIVFTPIDGIFCRVISTNVPNPHKLEFKKENIYFDQKKNLLMFFPKYEILAII